jgi:2-dehydropantoate 2-reductase
MPKAIRRRCFSVRPELKRLSSEALELETPPGQGHVENVMKVLVIGRGVVGTIYGWAFSKAGIDVTHVVRKQGLPDTDTLDLLDLRPGYSKNSQASYAPRTVAHINPSDGFDLVIVATKHYQAAEAIRQYSLGAPDATFLLFTANWDGPGEIDRLLPRSSILWGYAAASGGPDDRGTLIATVNPTVRFGILEGSDPEEFKAVTELFQRARFKLEIKPNIIEWLWVHHAINAGGIGICLWAGGIAEATRSFPTLRLGALATREALDVVAARGVDLERYPDARSVLHTPAWLAGPAYMCAIRFTEKGRRLLRASHFTHSPEEMKRYYFDVLNTGESLGVAMPHLFSLRERIERYPASDGAKTSGAAHQF